MNIGHVSVQNGILLAPMEDVSDLPFRVICRRLGADIVYTEFISSDGLIRDAKRSLHKLALSPEENPVAIQIFGGDIPTMVEAARRAEESNPDFLDINCGCWVKNVVARSAGAALLKDPPRMAAMTRALVDAVKLPVTVKTRLGWNPDSIVILEVAKMLEDAGAAALTVHCRTRDMGHSGSADWSWIPRIKQVVNIPVILNGDVCTPQDVKRAFAETGCDAVMIGRAAIANPFIFRQAKHFMQHGVEEAPVTIDERIGTCLMQLRMEVDHSGNERRSVLSFRKFIAGYLKGLYMSHTVRRDLMSIESYDGVEERMLRYADDFKNDRLRPADNDTDDISAEHRFETEPA
ncbi:MAG: tRNA dihydrouridine synthase DusB [Candidatus Kapabacteria bacterium]|nr:tRNA dihydrouridine synthase DusB [Candidatus Kapabacteria bacterium]